jgi:hypothetical protein
MEKGLTPRQRIFLDRINPLNPQPNFIVMAIPKLSTYFQSRECRRQDGVKSSVKNSAHSTDRVDGAL